MKLSIGFALPKCTTEGMLSLSHIISKMAAFGNFCRKSICDKSQFQVQTNKNSEELLPPSGQLLKLT